MTKQPVRSVQILSNTLLPLTEPNPLARRQNYFVLTILTNCGLEQIRLTEASKITGNTSFRLYEYKRAKRNELDMNSNNSSNSHKEILRKNLIWPSATKPTCLSNTLGVITLLFAHFTIQSVVKHNLPQTGFLSVLNFNTSTNRFQENIFSQYENNARFQMIKKTN